MRVTSKPAFLRRAKERGWKVLDGWPESLLIKKGANGSLMVQVFTVEPSSADELIIAALVLQGIDCFHWSECEGSRKYERIDAQTVMDRYFQQTDQGETRNAVRELTARGVRARL